jgi:hypothetical protein
MSPQFAIISLGDFSYEARLPLARALKAQTAALLVRSHFVFLPHQEHITHHVRGL